jgi:acyl carrier protein
MIDVELRVRQIIEDDLGLSNVQVADDLVIDHGIDDIGLLSVAMRLEEEFHLEERSVSEEALIHESTVKKCVELVRQATPDRKDGSAL